MRKTFGPQEDPPSRADSFVGGPWYDDSYHTQDSRRSALPTSMLQHMVGGTAPGTAAGSVPNSLQPARSNPPSVINMFFPDNSMRGGGTVHSLRRASGNIGGYGRSGSYGGTAVRGPAGRSGRTGIGGSASWGWVKRHHQPSSGLAY